MQVGYPELCRKSESRRSVVGAFARMSRRGYIVISYKLGLSCMQSLNCFSMVNISRTRLFGNFGTICPIMMKSLQRERSPRLAKRNLIHQTVFAALFFITSAFLISPNLIYILFQNQFFQNYLIVLLRLVVFYQCTFNPNFYFKLQKMRKHASQSQKLVTQQIKKQLRKTNFYDMLQVDRNASEAEVKKSYKKMALKYHPDKNSAEGSKEAFSKISEAYDTLSDPSKRIIYDEKHQYNQKLSEKKKFNKGTKNSYSYSQFGNDRFNNNAEYNNFEKQQARFEKMFNKRSAQQKNDQKAREQRYFYQKQGSEGQQKSKSQSPESGNSRKNNKTQKQNQQAFYKKYASKKSQFGSKVSNRPSYQQYSSNLQKQIRLQKQRQRIAYKLKQVKIGIFIFVLWMFLSQIGPSLKGKPIYSMRQNYQYPIKLNTSELNSPYFVSQQYKIELSNNLHLKQNLQRKVDTLYIKSLSKVCSNMMQKQQQIQIKLSKVKSKKSKNKLRAELEKINKQACKLLYVARQSSPQYFSMLFQQPQYQQQQNQQSQL